MTPSLVAASGSLMVVDTAYTYDGVQRYASHFTGKERDDETGLDLMGARHFGILMGRFMQADPNGFTDVTGLGVGLDCSKVSSDQSKQGVTDLNKRKDARFQVSRKEKTGFLESKARFILANSPRAKAHCTTRSTTPITAQCSSLCR